MCHIKFYTQHELTWICRTLSAAFSSSLESVFGSIQKHKSVIDTFPDEGTQIQCRLHPYCSQNCNMLLTLWNKNFFTNWYQLSLFWSFQILYWKLSVRLVIQTGLEVEWPEFLATYYELPSSIYGSTMEIFPWRGRFPSWSWSGKFSRN
jgi:hypothetical protein